MNELTLNLLAIGVFLMTLSVLLGPLLNFSSAIPAIVVGAVLSAVTVDVFSLEGKGGNLFLDWLAAFSPLHRERIIRHEAGHFLVAQLLEIPVTDYSVSAWEAIRKGFSGQGGVQFDTSVLDEELRAGRISSQWLDRFCTVWMAGIAAEQLVYEASEGGADDRLKFRSFFLHDVQPRNTRKHRPKLQPIVCATFGSLIDQLFCCDPRHPHRTKSIEPLTRNPSRP